MEYISTLSVMNQVLALWMLPSLSLFLLFLQIRHFDNETIPQFFKYQDLTTPIMMIIIWPVGILALLFIGITLPLIFLNEKVNINLSFLVTDFKFK